MTILVTGASGFIGCSLCKLLLEKGYSVVGIDNLNNYYDPYLKQARLNQLESELKFNFIKGDLVDKKCLNSIFERYNPKIVFNLAAQAGVRYSIENPDAYIQSNLVGFGNLLECCRHSMVEHLLYASSSSVYGGNTSIPFSEKQGVNHPISLYAATKKSNELMAHCYSHLYSIPSTGLRFFTVYGPWGRPDMAPFLFTQSILEGKSIRVFNNGQMLRDFTYIDDITESLFRLIHKPPSENKLFDRKDPDSSCSWAPYKIFNIGNSTPVPLMEFIECLELEIGLEARKEFMPIQPGDVRETLADTSSLEEWIGFKPQTSIRDGVARFVKWYRDFYKV